MAKELENVMNSTQKDHYQSQFSAVWPELPGYKTSWMDQLRLKAINNFTENGFPPPRSEEWKYTRLDPILEQNFRIQSKRIEELGIEQINNIAGEIPSVATLVFVNGQFSTLVAKNGDADQLEITNLNTALKSNQNLVKKYLSEKGTSSTAFESLNMAFMSDGLFFKLGKDKMIDKPIQLLHLTTSDFEQPVNFNTRNIIVVEQGSKASFVERYVSLGKKTPYLSNIVSQLVLEPGSKLDHYKIQDESEDAFHLAVTRVQQAEASNYSYHTYSYGSRLSRNDVTVTMNERDAECSLNGLFMLDGERQSDNYSEVVHGVPNCSSDELFKGILDEQAKGVFKGKIFVHQDAQKTDARLNNNNLLLSDDAEVVTMPQLEIYADDVKCSHGSSTGQIDQEQLYYIRSRGLDVETAKNLLVLAFGQSVIDRSKDNRINAYLLEQLISKLPSGEQLKELVR